MQAYSNPLTNLVPPRIALAVLFHARPDKLVRVLAALAPAWPDDLDVVLVSDGPRRDRAEQGSVAECRRVAESFFPRNRIKRLYATENMGCRLRIQSGLDFVFEHYDAAVVLEDDCLPSKDFIPFILGVLRDPYARQLYGIVSGFNKYPKPNGGAFASDWIGIWGWGTWREKWSAARSHRLGSGGRVTICRAIGVAGLLYGLYFWWNLRRVGGGGINTWDYEWCYGAVAEGYKCVYPSGNMIENIGFGAGATHTFKEQPVVPHVACCRYSGLPVFRVGYRYRRLCEMCLRKLSMGGLW